MENGIVKLIYGFGWQEARKQEMKWSASPSGDLIL